MTCSLPTKHQHNSGTNACQEQQESAPTKWSLHSLSPLLPFPQAAGIPLPEHSLWCRPWLQWERGERRGLAQRGAEPQLAALCPAPARCERPGKGGKASGKRGKKGWGRGGKLSARETAAFWREAAALRREMQQLQPQGCSQRHRTRTNCRDASHARDAVPRLCLR